MANSTITLWRQADFQKLLISESVSAFGSAITDLALPLVAIITLQAGAREMGFLQALQTLPVLLFGLFVGVWVDRVKRRPLMIAVQFGRALLLAMIPLTAWLGILRVEMLYVLSFLMGTLGVIFDLAVTSFVPTIVHRTRLIEGNAALQGGQAAASLSGEGLGGLLVQTLTAPFAMAIDAVTFLFSSVYLIFIEANEPPPTPLPSRGKRAEISEGLRFIFQDRILAPLTIGTAISSFSLAIYQTVIILYLSRALAIEPVWLGIILTCRSLGALSSTLLSKLIADRIGPGRSLIVALALETIGMGLIPFISGSKAFIMLAVGFSQISFGLGSSLYSITQISLRQRLTPDRLLGRVNASRRVLVFGVMPMGGLMGGLLGESIGWRGTLLVSGAVLLGSTLFHLSSPLRRPTLTG